MLELGRYRAPRKRQGEDECVGLSCVQASRVRTLVADILREHEREGVHVVQRHHVHPVPTDVHGNNHLSGLPHQGTTRNGSTTTEPLALAVMRGHIPTRNTATKNARPQAGRQAGRGEDGRT